MCALGRLTVHAQRERCGEQMGEKKGNLPDILAQAEGAAEAAALLPVPAAVATMALEGPAAAGRLPEVLPGQVLPYSCAPALQAPLLQLQVCTLPAVPSESHSHPMVGLA